MTPKLRKFARLGAAVALLVIAGVIAMLATRSAPEKSGPAAHEHGQMAAGGDAPQAVVLSDDVARRIGVTYGVVTEEKLEREIRTVGQVAYDETRVRMIAPKVDGWVERLYADAMGQEVAVGAPLMTLYSPMVVAAQEELLLARRLAADVAQGDSSAQRHAATLLTSARSRLAAWDVPAGDVARIENNGRVERTITIHTSVAGFVIEKNVIQGQRVMAGDVLYRIADLRRVWLEGEVFEQDLAGIRVGQPATAELLALPGTPVTGRVAYVYPMLSAETRTARIRVEVSNPGYRLKPGMVATLRVIAGTLERVLTVPRAAVLSTGDRHLVFVKRPDGMLEPHVVDIGATTADRVTILRGLVRGDTVVASGTFLVDAESSLGTILGGMGDMPGMDIAKPRQRD